MQGKQSPKNTPAAPTPGSSRTAAQSREVLDRFYLRVLGFAYQVLGDAELAAQAAESIFLQSKPPATELAVWQAAMQAMQAYVARGFVVRPLVPLGQGWQAKVLAGLATLQPLERALLLLRYHEGLEPALLAKVLGRKESDLRAQIAAARGALLDQMDAP